MSAAAAPEQSTTPTPAGSAKAVPAGRRRSKSFYGREPEKPAGGIERKPTSVDLQNIILRLTLKENIQKEIDKWQAAGDYAPLTQPEGFDVFEEQATECLKQGKDDIKKYRDTPPGQALLKQGVKLFKYFEEREQHKELIDELYFHVKCLVDDLLFQFLVDAPVAKA